jgi:LAO/AO transport system kinase
MLVPTVARTATDRPRPKRPEVMVTTASTGDGVPELLAALDRHRAAGREDLEHGPRRARAASQVRAILADRLADRLDGAALSPLSDSVIDEVAAHRLDPYAAADRLFTAMVKAER